LWLAPWPISILVLSIIAGWFLQPLQSTHMTCYFNHATLYTTVLPVQPLVHCTPLTQTSHGLAIFQYSVPSYNFLGSPLITTLVLFTFTYLHCVLPSTKLFSQFFFTFCYYSQIIHIWQPQWQSISKLSQLNIAFTTIMNEVQNA